MAYMGLGARKWGRTQNLNILLGEMKWGKANSCFAIFVMI